MKNLKKVLMTALVFSGVLLNAGAEEAKIEAYAHPTMFGGDAQILEIDNSSYLVGGKLMKSKNRIGVKNKENVLVNSWVKDILNLIKEQGNVSNGGLFNPKLPVLRSELAIIIAEGFKIEKSGKVLAFTDIPSNYWAKDWIYKTTGNKIMIGYPDHTFKPDQPVTKAEVFATIAQMVDVPINAGAKLPEFKGKEIKFVPNWATNATKEVLASKLLNEIPNPDRVNENEYLSKEQVAYLIGSLRNDLGYRNGFSADKNAPDVIKNYAPVYLNVKLSNRLSAKHSNIGDKFSATLLKDVKIASKEFKSGSKVTGEVVEVKRPGYKNEGFIKVKFVKITDGNLSVEFPKNISQADAVKIKDPNFVARLVSMPFSTSARVVGVSGRTAGAIVNTVANGAEQYGDNLSNGFAEVLSVEPVAGVKSFGTSFVTIFKGVYNICKATVSGAFGVVYEIGDEILYTIVPSKSNNSSLNPGEELTIIF